MRLQMRWSRLTVRTLVALYLLVDFALLVRESLSHPTARDQGQQAFWICVDVFLLYRITRGSQWAWVLALLLTAITIPLLMFATVAATPLVAALLATSIVQLALLTHLAIRRRVGIGRSRAGAPI